MSFGKLTPITRDQADSVADIADSFRWVLSLPELPGGGNGGGRINVQCAAFSAPGISNQSYDATMGGHSVNFRGRVVYPTRAQATFHLDGKGTVLQALLLWHEYSAGSFTNNSQGYIDDYAVTANLGLFDTTGRTYQEYQFYRMYIDNIQEFALNSEQSQAINLSCELRYSYYRDLLRGAQT